MTLEERIARIEDLNEIRSLRNKYHHAVNSNTPESFAEIYTRDAVVYFDEFMKQEGLDNILAASRRLSDNAFVKQFLHNHEIELHGDTAKGYCYLDARYAADGESMIVAARYDDEYRRTEAGWRISMTRVNIIFSVPLSQGWANLDAAEIGRSRFAELARNLSETAAPS